MAKSTIEYGQCLNAEPHETHKFRPAIFGLSRKVICRGVKAPKPPHKHMLRLHMYPEYPFINPAKVVGHCSGCGTWCSIDKEDFYMVLRGEAYYHMIKEEALDPVR